MHLDTQGSELLWGEREKPETGVRSCFPVKFINSVHINRQGRELSSKGAKGWPKAHPRTRPGSAGSTRAGRAGASPGRHSTGRRKCTRGIQLLSLSMARP